MVTQDPEAHDELYVEMWGPLYRNDPEYVKWIASVKADPSRGLRAFKNDLSDRLHERTRKRKNERKGW